MKHIGENIKRLRTTQGFSQEQVASHLGISRAQLSYYENFTRNEVPPVTMLHKLSDLFCVDLTVLLEKDFDQASIDSSFAFRSSEMNEKDLEAVSNFHKLVKNYVKMQKLLHAH